MMTFEVSCDDNCYENYRLARILEKYKIPATFYLPIDDIDWDFVGLLKSKGFNIGSHTITHPQDMKQLSYEEKWNEIQTSKDLLEAYLNKPVESICWPRGRYDKECVVLAKEAGYKWARNTKVGCTDKTQASFTKDTTMHWYQRKEYGNVDLLKYAKRKFNEAYINDGVFHLWTHGWELTRYQEWDRIETLINYVSKNKS